MPRGKAKVKRPRKAKEESTALVVADKKQSAIQLNTGLNPQSLMEAALKSGASMDVLERFMDLSDRAAAKQAEMAFRDSMSAFQSECPIIIKKRAIKGKDGKLRYKFAPIEDILSQKNIAGMTVKELLGRYGFSYMFRTEQKTDPPTMKVIIRISHLAGHSEETDFTIGKDPSEYMTDPQRWLSARSFAMRVTFLNGFGIVSGNEDNDASTQGDPEEEKRQAEEEERKKKAKAQLDALPANIKKGFDILGYKFGTQWQFCNDREWDNDKIMAEINKIIDKKAQ